MTEDKKRKKKLFGAALNNKQLRVIEQNETKGWLKIEFCSCCSAWENTFVCCPLAVREQAARKDLPSQEAHGNLVCQKVSEPEPLAWKYSGMHLSSSVSNIYVLSILMLLTSEMNMKPHPWWISVVYTVFLAPGHEQIHQQTHRWYYISRATGAVQLAPPPHPPPCCCESSAMVYTENRRSGAAPRKTKRYCLISHLLFITENGWDWRTSRDSNNTTTCSFVTTDVTDNRSFLNLRCNISFWNVDISPTAALCKSALAPAKGFYCLLLSAS